MLEIWKRQMYNLHLKESWVEEKLLAANFCIEL